MIRKATEQDLPAFAEIYEAARRYMRANGNQNQWTGGYPSEEWLREDIENGELYAVEREGKTVGAFVLMLREEPTYAVIEGAWHQNKPYGVIHRIAQNGTARGIFTEVEAFAFTKTDYLRIDTHADNKVMQGVLAAHGFAPCGTIYLETGDPRLAYDKRK